MVLLEEIGYEVETSSTAAPDRIYQRIAFKDADLTLDAWLPGHLSWFEGVKHGQRIGDLLTVVEPPLQPSGGLQGFLVTRSWAEAEGITHLGQINDDPLLASALDSDENGKGEIYGCPEEWTCDDIINSFLYFNEWDSLEQLMDVPGRQQLEQNDALLVYDSLFAEFVARVDRGQPAIAYTWTPTSYYSQAAIGEKTMWLSVTDAAALEGARNLWEYDLSPDRLNPDGTAGFSDVSDKICTQGPDGCQLGFVGASIQAVANTEWLAANPRAEALLESIELDTSEMSGLLLELEQLELDDWDADNPDRVSVWVAAVDR